MRRKSKNKTLLAKAREALVEYRIFWVFLLIALCFGGGGRGANIANLIVQIAALVMVALNLDHIRNGWSRIGWGAKAVLIATLALPLVQLIPLPPVLWTQLPGREILVEAHEVTMGQPGWAPISLVPGVTLLALTGLIAPLVVFLVGASMRKTSTQLALAVLVAAALLCTAIGAMQLLSGGSLQFYETGDPGYLHGLFANHNSTGLFLVIALCALIELAFASRLRPAILAVAAALGFALAVAVILTQSRSSLALMLMPLALVAFHIVARTKFGGNRILGIAATGAIVLAGVGVAALAITSNERMAQTIERFDTTANLRPALWADARSSAERFFPVGSGMGTFDEVFQLDESLETLYPARAGRAHNDYLEILIEAGVVGVLVLFSWVAYAGLGILRSGGSQIPSRAFYIAVAGCFAAQSLIDYPLRNQALLCVAALIMGMLAGSRANGRTREKELPGV